MHRFHVSPAECGETTITLAGGEAHHALRVLRLRFGDAAVVLDGAGGEYHCEVASASNQTVDLAVRRKRLEPRSPCEITLVQAVPKGKLFDSIVQKATELGASRVIPLLTDRVVRQFDDEKSDSQLHHWRAVAIESIKQCGSLWLPQIDAPTSVASLLSRQEAHDLSLIASLETGGLHPRKWFQKFREQSVKPNPDSICVWVGPEGDFTSAELAAAKAAGALPITLGPLVLRSETAAIYCLSVLGYEISAL